MKHLVTDHQIQLPLRLLSPQSLYQYLKGGLLLEPREPVPAPLRDVARVAAGMVRADRAADVDEPDRDALRRVGHVHALHHIALRGLDQR